MFGEGADGTLRTLCVLCALCVSNSSGSAAGAFRAVGVSVLRGVVEAVLAQLRPPFPGPSDEGVGEDKDMAFLPSKRPFAACPGEELLPISRLDLCHLFGEDDRRMSAIQSNRRAAGAARQRKEAIMKFRWGRLIALYVFAGIVFGLCTTPIQEISWPAAVGIVVAALVAVAPILNWLIRAGMAKWLVRQEK